MTTIDTIPEDLLAPVMRLARDVVDASIDLSEREVRFLVDSYYEMQDRRKTSVNQQRDLEKNDEPNRVISWLAEQDKTLEDQIKRALDRYSASQPLGVWCRSIVGIGPVITAGLLAHIDFSRIHTAGAIWRYAGLDPSVTWQKGMKRPWNASLKTLCWKIGDSFVKFSNHPNDFYGRFYRERKEVEEQRNENGGYAKEAARVVKERKWVMPRDAATKAAYEAGRFPQARIDLRARRIPVKLFLSHFFEVGYELHHGVKPPVPYVFTKAGHAHYIPPPNIEVAFPGRK